MTQSLTEPSNIILVGPISARIKFDLSLSQWLYSDPRFNVTATSKASQKSYALGKHNWTVTGDKCSEGNDYTLEMKLTGCNNTQFTMVSVSRWWNDATNYQIVEISQMSTAARYLL